MKLYRYKFMWGTFLLCAILLTVKGQPLFGAIFAAFSFFVLEMGVFAQKVDNVIDVLGKSIDNQGESLNQSSKIISNNRFLEERVLREILILKTIDKRLTDYNASLLQILKRTNEVASVFNIPKTDAEEFVFDAPHLDHLFNPSVKSK